MNSIFDSMMKLYRCEDCPIRCKATTKPKSIFARIHRWHLAWWPGWRIYQAELRARNARAARA